MTANQLIDALKDSGTGVDKLDKLREHLAAHPGCTAEALVLHAATLGVAHGFGRVTLEKAIRLAGLQEKYALADGPPALPPALRMAQGIKTVATPPEPPKPVEPAPEPPAVEPEPAMSMEDIVPKPETEQPRPFQGHRRR